MTQKTIALICASGEKPMAANASSYQVLQAATQLHIHALQVSYVKWAMSSCLLATTAVLGLAHLVEQC